MVGPSEADGNWEPEVPPEKPGVVAVGPGGNGLSGRLYV